MVPESEYFGTALWVTQAQGVAEGKKMWSPARCESGGGVRPPYSREGLLDTTRAAELEAALNLDILALPFG